MSGGRDIAEVLSGNTDLNAPALHFTADGRTGARVSRADLFAAINAAAARVEHGPVAPGGVIAICGANAPEHFTATLGVARAGRIAAPMNVKLPPADQAALIEQIGAAEVWADAFSRSALADTLDPKPLATPLRGFADAGHGPVASGDQIALLMFTSGSTGLPKGVPITHGAYRWAFERFQVLRPVIEGRRCLVAAPIFHMNGQFHLLNILACGGEVVLMARFDPDRFLDAVDAFDVRRVTGVPPMMARCLQVARERRFANVETVALGSAPLSPGLSARIADLFPNAVVTNGYGTTETGPVSFGAHPDGLPTPPGALGRPMPGVELKLMGGEGPDEGVLHLRSPMTARGYWRREAGGKFDSAGWCDTGDVMRRDADGFYFFEGRADDMFVTNGENVYPGPIERALEAHPSVSQAVVLPVADDAHGAAPMALAVAAGAPPSEAELQAFVLEQVAAYAHPRRIFFVESLPVSGPNKIDRRAAAGLLQEHLRREGETA
ncbi:MAG: class I adenylate-forming enzyme family protein [Oceanicaulis sp.]